MTRCSPDDSIRQAWTRGQNRGIGEYAETYPWLLVDPTNPDRLVGGFKSNYGDFGPLSVVQESTDAAQTWSNDFSSIVQTLQDQGLLGCDGAGCAGRDQPRRDRSGQPEHSVRGRSTRRYEELGRRQDLVRARRRAAHSAGRTRLQTAPHPVGVCGYPGRPCRCRRTVACPGRTPTSGCSSMTTRAVNWAVRLSSTLIGAADTTVSSTTLLRPHRMAPNPVPNAESGNR